MRALTTLLAAAVLAIPAPAEAEDAPGAPPATPEDGAAACGIRILRAPAALRGAVEAALAADATACGGQLDVWLVPTDGGVYVQARDRLGRVRERVVPDAETTATLLASWVEIDAAAVVWAPDAPPPPPAAVEAPAAPAAAPTAPAEDVAPVVAAAEAPSPVAAAPSPPAVALAPPGAVAVAASAPRPAARRRSFGLGVAARVTGTGMEGAGPYVAVDLRRVRGWQLAVTGTGMFLDGPDLLFVHANDPSLWVDEVERQAFEVTLSARRTWRIGRLTVSPGVGAGAAVTRHQLYLWGPSMDYASTHTSLGPRVEAAVTASTPIAGRFRLEAGVAAGLGAFWQLDGAWDRIPVWGDGTTTFLVGLRHE